MLKKILIIHHHLSATLKQFFKKLIHDNLCGSFDKRDAKKKVLEAEDRTYQ